MLDLQVLAVRVVFNNKQIDDLMIIYINQFLSPCQVTEVWFLPDLGRDTGKTGWIREKSALDIIQNDFLLDRYCQMNITRIIPFP